MSNFDEDFARGRHGHVTAPRNEAERQGKQMYEFDQARRQSESTHLPTPWTAPVIPGPIEPWSGDSRGLGDVLVIVARGIAASGVFCVLYPLTVATALAAVAVPMAILLFVVTKDAAWLIVVGFFASLVLGGITLRVASHVEQRLSQHHAYRVVRHVLRLMILAMLLFWAIGDPGPRNTVWTWTGAQTAFERAQTSPLWLLIGGIGLIAAHFFLQRSRLIRGAWHARLEKWGYR
jgi:hypothetical protein